MFERFRDSIVYPVRILNFRKDSFVRVVLYILTFSVLMSTGTILSIVTFDSVPVAFKDVFEESLIDTPLDCEIVSSELVCTEEINQMFYDDGLLTVSVDSNVEIELDSYSFTNVNVIIHDNQISLYYVGLEGLFNIDELPSEFRNLDFGLVESDPEAFTNQVLDGFGNYIIENMSLYGTIVIVFSVLG